MTSQTLLAPAPPASPAPATTGYRWRWLAVVVLLGAEVMDLLDSTVVNVAGPTIRADLGGSAATIQWIAAGYTLAFAIGLITGGRLGDIVGRKRMFLVGTAGFTLASVLCAVAPTPTALIAFRVLQGGLGAVMIPQGFGIVKAMFPPKELARPFAVFGPVLGLAAVCGPILGGALIRADLFGSGWRMVFGVNLPLGLVALAAGAALLPESRSPYAPRLDVPGMLLAMLGSVLLVYPLVQGRELGWPLWTLAMLAASPLVGALFWRHQRRLARRGGSPLVEPGLFGKRSFSAGLVVGVLFFAAMTGLLLTFGLYLQLGIGYAPLAAGLTMAAWSLGISIGSALAGAVLVRRYGRTVLHAGTVLMAAGVAGTALTLALAGTGVTGWAFAPAFLLTGLGMGLLLAPYVDIVLAGVEEHEVGVASGVLSATQQLGSSLGVALLGTVFFALVGMHAGGAAAAAAPALRSELAAAAVGRSTQDAIVRGLADCAADQAELADPKASPDSCTGLAATAGLPAGSAAAARVDAAVQAAQREVDARSFGTAVQGVSWIATGLLALTFLAALALPRHARPAEH